MIQGNINRTVVLVTESIIKAADVSQSQNLQANLETIPSHGGMKNASQQNKWQQKALISSKGIPHQATLDISRQEEIHEKYDKIPKKNPE